MSKTFKAWLERVEAPEITSGMIRHFCTAIVPRSMGYEMGGHRTTLSSQNCQDIVEAFDARVERDGGPLVTSEQAEIGRRWLTGQWKRVGMPEADYSTITCFRFVNAAVLDENSYRAMVAPEYAAFFADGSVLRYAPTSWMTTNSKYIDWRWVRQGGTE